MGRNRQTIQDFLDFDALSRAIFAAVEDRLDPADQQYLEQQQQQWEEDDDRDQDH